ncbi:MAG: hypothetical protein ACOVQ4_23590, partial [Flectobacillus sp.]|uniref:hypothetical protein n=1 Tax=Flectobacillus sp. TaxID=50419 RepID=UPI003B9C4860
QIPEIEDGNGLFGSESEQELIQVGLNSLFGVLQYVMSQTGFTYKELMWDVSWTLVSAMLQDMPKSVKREQIVLKASGKMLAERRKNGR